MPQEIITLMAISTLIVFDTNHIAMFSDLLKVEKLYLKCIFLTFYLCKNCTLTQCLAHRKVILFPFPVFVGVWGGEPGRGGMHMHAEVKGQLSESILSLRNGT